jgi:hypothetical protein
VKVVTPNEFERRVQWLSAVERAARERESNSMTPQPGEKEVNVDTSLAMKIKVTEPKSNKAKQ